MLHTFQVTTRHVERSLPCQECGKIVRRSFKGEASYNPFNDGNPPEQALATAERAARYAEFKGIVCRWCSERPFREALIAFADGHELPPRQWNNPTDILIDRGNVEEVVDQSPCPTCGHHQWKPLGYRLTEKGARLAEKLKAQTLARGEA